MNECMYSGAVFLTHCVEYSTEMGLGLGGAYSQVCVKRRLHIKTEIVDLCIQLMEHLVNVT